MCGVCGVVTLGPTPAPIDAVPDMVAALHHRGPDRQATWIEPEGRASFGHARLSIVDLSPAGDQPMTSADGRWTITYNGELYNAAEFRRALPPEIRLRGHSDTEVLLESIAVRGPLAAVTAARGMFAFAVWDAREAEVWLARDRFGEKPLYYGVDDDRLVFGSELKALREVPGFRPGIDRRALAEYFRWTHVPSPLSILEGVAKLPPAHLLRVPVGRSVGRAVTRTGDLRPEAYWSAAEAAATAVSQPTGDEAVERVEDVLARSVAEQMVSDVPLGAFLSGGIDSSTIVALMQRTSSTPVRTFTIGFEDRSYDESGFAAAVAGHLGTEHTDLVLSAADTMDVVPDLPTVYDEPFADSSQVPTTLVSRLARESVTVALSGDGGDELFGGYERYRGVDRLSRLRGLVPGPVRHRLGIALAGPSVATWDRIGGRLPTAVVPVGLRHRTGHRVHKVAALLGAEGEGSFYEAMMSIESDRGLVLGAGPASETSWTAEPAGRVFSPSERAMLVDTGAYLPDDLLTKVDRASMSVSLEVRVPFLSPEVFEVAWGLRPEDRMRGTEGKWVLRRVLDRILPNHLVDRPKMGFGVPVGDWLRGPLRDWADDMLSPAMVARQGYLDSKEVARRWEAHRSGATDLTFQVWSLLVFQSWLERWESS